MSTGSRGVFLCPTCGNVATGQGDGTAVCQKCDFGFQLPKEVHETNALPGKPLESTADATGLIKRDIGTLGMPKQPKSGGTKLQEPLQVRDSKEVENKHRPHRQKRKRPIKKKKNYPLIFGLWLLMVAALSLAALWLSGIWDENEEVTQSVVSKLTGEERQFYLKEFPSLDQQFRGFVRANSEEEQKNFVRRVPAVGRMIQKYNRESSSPIPAGRLAEEPFFWNVAHEETPGFVEAAWRVGEQDELEAVFVKESDEWRLDWEQFVRYGTQNWALFRQNLAPVSSGVFRLYLEKLDEGQVSENSWVKIRFYEPVRDQAHRLASASQIIKLESSDPVSTQVAQAFVDRAGESEGYSKLWRRDPKNLRRVTVALGWGTDPSTGEEVLVVRNILAHHWRTLTTQE